MIRPPWRSRSDRRLTPLRRVPGAGSRPGPRSRSQTGRAELMAPAQLDHPSLHLGRGLGRASSGPTRAILEARLSGLLVATPPLVSGLAGDPHRLGRSGHRPALLDHPAEPQSTLRGQRSVTVHREPSLALWVCQQLHIALEAHFIRGFSCQQGPWVEHLGLARRSRPSTRCGPCDRAVRSTRERTPTLGPPRAWGQSDGEMGIRRRLKSD